jgi:nicotinamidase-related amidase
MIDLDSKTSALVLIDLQNAVLGNVLLPISAADLLLRGQELAGRFRAAGAPVVLVRVSFSADGGEILRQRVDELPPGLRGGYQPGWDEFPPGLMLPGDLVITKRQWGAFHGTELDLQLRRRGIRSIVLGGAATQIGVESTARQAWEHGYEIVLATDATTSIALEPHEMSIKHIMPRLARLAASADIRLVA